jgi:hypothetical protein
MGYLSKYLTEYLRTAGADQQAQVKVVVGTGLPAPATISRIPRTAEVRAAALEAIRATGVGGSALRPITKTRRIRPQEMS